MAAFGAPSYVIVLPNPVWTVDFHCPGAVVFFGRTERAAREIIPLQGLKMSGCDGEPSAKRARMEDGSAAVIVDEVSLDSVAHNFAKWILMEETTFRRYEAC